MAPHLHSYLLAIPGQSRLWYWCLGCQRWWRRVYPAEDLGLCLWRQDPSHNHSPRSCFCPCKCSPFSFPVVLWLPTYPDRSTCLRMAQRICFRCPFHCQCFFWRQWLRLWQRLSRFRRFWFEILRISLPSIFHFRGRRGKPSLPNLKVVMPIFFGFFRQNERVFLVGLLSFKPSRSTSVRPRALCMYQELGTWVDRLLRLLCLQPRCVAEFQV